ncbi:unnamed protein product [Mytilus coruscus]|uniref:Uncharacterized protein n=1 Tax=Mytilus coruscus TaxID=42192 RepID=A0A6J8EPR4_MYTCO|nr:unnamed protein product [Mytilus coruscus]
MEIARRSDRVKTKRSAYTPAKPARKAVIVASTNDKSPKINTTDHSAGYTLNKNKAIRQKLDASNRTCSVVPEFSPGNLVLTFTADNKDQQQNDYCPTCENLCSSDDKAVECEICNRWLHYECEKLTVKEVDEIENNLTLQYKLSISATPTTTCNNTNILEEEIKDLKSQLGLKDKQLKTKESLICKQDSEIKLMKKELATNRALTIKLEQDKKDLEHSLLIQQKPSNTVHEPSAFNREDNSRSYAMEQRVCSLELELLKQDNKISNLSDKFIDFKIEHDRKQQRTRKNKQKVTNKHSADQFKFVTPSNDSCSNILFDSELEMRDDEAGVEQSPIHNISCTNQSPFLGYARAPKRHLPHMNFSPPKKPMYHPPPTRQRNQNHVRQPNAHRQYQAIPRFQSRSPRMDHPIQQSTQPRI